MTKKLSNFFLLIGLLLFIVFLAAPTQSELFRNFCFGSVVLFLLALGLRQFGREEKPPSGRFRLIRKLFGKND
ncbi:MAG: hypothetical protein MAG431_01574 [Chloroflexi bacterium]|nr:hypothetical protein [Chloroflexota bacterium]